MSITPRRRSSWELRRQNDRSHSGGAKARKNAPMLSNAITWMTSSKRTDCSDPALPEMTIAMLSAIEATESIFMRLPATFF
jgi:hypothetical protein